MDVSDGRAAGRPAIRSDVALPPQAGPHIGTAFKAHTIGCFDTDVRMHTEAGDHGTAGALEGILLPVDLISQTHDAPAGVGTNSNPATYGVGQQSGHPGSSCDNGSAGSAC